MGTELAIKSHPCNLPIHVDWHMCVTIVVWMAWGPKGAYGRFPVAKNLGQHIHLITTQLKTTCAKNVGLSHKGSIDGALWLEILYWVQNKYDPSKIRKH